MLASELNREFSYDPWKGTLKRKVIRKNARVDIVHRNCDDYPKVFFRGVSTTAHRIAYIMYHGYIPDGMEIDHINRNKSDYRIVNLRAVTRKVNMENRGLMKNNTSGFKGVVFHKEQQKWFGRKMRGGIRKTTAYYSTPEEANAELQTF